MEFDCDFNELRQANYTPYRSSTGGASLKNYKASGYSATVLSGGANNPTDRYSLQDYNHRILDQDDEL